MHMKYINNIYSYIGAYIGERLQLEQLAKLDTFQTQTQCHKIRWHPTKDSILLSNSDEISYWSIDDSDVKVINKIHS